MMDELTRDAFLGGKLQLLQPQTGYRAGLDAVLLAATVPAEAGDRVLDLGCGVGAAALCLGARVPGLSLTGIEMQPDYAELARRNGAGTFEVITADLTDLPLEIRQRQFDHVLANPPYFDRGASRAAHDAGREVAHGETAPLTDWIKVAAKRLAPKGLAHIIHRAERLPEILITMTGRLGSIEVLPLSARVGRAPDRVIVRGRKNGRGAFKLYAPLVLHEGAQHVRDGNSYVPRVDAALRRGAALEFHP